MKIKSILKILYPNRDFKVQAGQFLEKRLCGDDPSRGLVWTVSGETVEQLVSQKLGFDPFCGFVKIVNGRIGFSCGKPEEIKSLYRQCEQFGIPMSAGLKNSRA